MVITPVVRRVEAFEGDFDPIFRPVDWFVLIVRNVAKMSRLTIRAGSFAGIAVVVPVGRERVKTVSIGDVFVHVENDLPNRRLSRVVVDRREIGR
ncbi:hypothetical protein ZOD2009_19078 [Haladaptatus paucihalophilus DX253]|uniref:Uncharacterized protein n=1 Tax=Haladaptatus paucihalophilus DX253 TaxID=797209 RepID=E7QYC5_HALPU|nr:hypothetical protein ZOD2009_19078 [Haladaptatus paucihalophilus DX253]